jgi:transcriptional activator protein
MGDYMRLLICEDEEDILNGLAKGLRKLNYYVDTAMDGEEALSLYFESEYDLIVLDLNMPRLDGIEVLKAIREDNPDTKIIILSARDSLNDKVLGLDLGANDYLVKPFHFRELEARIRALLRTSYNKSDDIIRLESQDITIYLNKKQVQKNGENIPLTPKEYAIFEYLCLNKDALISTDELLEHNVDMNANDTSSVIKVHIAAIRKKLGSDVIKNTRGMGYTVND